MRFSNSKIEVFGTTSKRKEFVCQKLHASPMIRCFRFFKTYHRGGNRFFGKGLNKMWRNLWRNVKHGNIKRWNNRPLDFSQPLSIPIKQWLDISMDFIEGLPKLEETIILLVVVDRLSKYPHLLVEQQPFMASQVFKIFLDQIFCLHCMSEHIVNDKRSNIYNFGGNFSNSIGPSWIRVRLSSIIRWWIRNTQ